MSYYFAIINSLIIDPQKGKKVSIPISKNLKKKYNMVSGDSVFLFSTIEDQPLKRIKPIGNFTVRDISIRAKIQQELPKNIGSKYVVSFKQLDSNWFNFEIDINSVFEYADIPQNIDITKSHIHTIPIIFSVSESQFRSILKVPFKELKKLRETFNKSGIRAQKKLGAGWLYDIGEKDIYHITPFIKGNLKDSIVEEFIRDNLFRNPKSVDIYYDLIESFTNENILKLSWNGFEKKVTRLASKMGFKAIKSQQTSDGGIDVYVEDLRLFTRGKYIIQCKRTKSKIGVKDIKDLDSTVSTENAIKGLLISVSGFTREAIDYEKKTKSRIELLEWTNVLDYINAHFFKEN